MPIDKVLINSFVKTTERAAYGASIFKGKNDKIAADQAAVDEMRKVLNTINMKGKIVIGEGELDEAPMLYINEEVGTKAGEEFDIAVDPLEGTNFTAEYLPNALSVLAVARKGNLLQAPDIYMDKIAIGPNLPKNLLDLDFGVKKNIKLLSEAKNVKPDKLTACVLKRSRHNAIIKTLTEMNVKINFISDGDVSGVISVADSKTGIDIYIGIGGAPEGVLAAAALRCIGGQMMGRLVFRNNDEKKRARAMGVTDLNRKYSLHELAGGDVMFAATGVTDGAMLKGVHRFPGGAHTHSVVMRSRTGTLRLIEAEHDFTRRPPRD